MIPDKLLINLKILSKIQKNGKIKRSFDGIISLDSETFYQPVRRFITSDSRKQAVFEINSIVTESIEIFNHILNSKYMNKHYYNTDEYRKNCENLNLLLVELEHAKIGVENLKFTYQNDQNIVSQLDIIILKMITTIKDVSVKLLYYQSFLAHSIETKSSYTYDYLDTKIENNTQTAELTSIKVEEPSVVYDDDYNAQNDLDMNEV